MAELTDPDLYLLQGMANGDVRALDELYSRHGRRILSYLIGQLGDRQLAEEVLQDVMLAAWRGAAQFRGESKVKTWLVGIARLQALSVQRRRRPLSVPLDEAMPSADTGEFKVVERGVENKGLREALRELPSDQRETLELIFYHDLSSTEAAQVLGVAAGTVKSRLNRAKTTLRRLLTRKEAGYEW